MKLYHGSIHIVDKPRILELTHTSDFGRGFYCSSYKDQAISFAKNRLSKRSDANIAYVNCYEFNKDEACSNLKILKFQEGSKNWFDFVLANRAGKPENNDADIICGPVADDRVYRIVRFYETGVYSYDEAFNRLKAFDLYDQYVFKTEKSLEYISYTNLLEVSNVKN